MNKRQRYALIHPVDERTLPLLQGILRRQREWPDGAWSTVILAVDR